MAVEDMIYRSATSVADLAMLMSMMFDVDTDPEPKQQNDCGTPAAWRRHYRRGETIDEACRQTALAESKDQREKRKQTPPVRRKPPPDCGTVQAYDQHRYYREYPIDEACRSANADRVAGRTQRGVV